MSVRNLLQNDKPRLIVAVAAVLALAIWSVALLPGRATLDVTILDVGEGLCVVAQSPSGKTLVMDCGTSSWRQADEVGEKLVAPYLHRLGVGAIDVAVLSHPHSDHVSGFAGLLNTIPARLVLDTDAAHPSTYYRRFLKSVKRCGATYRTAKRGQSIDLGDGVTVQVLNPDPAETFSDLNDNCIVLRIVYKKTAFLLAADAGKEAEADMTASGLPLRSQALQVAHHGGEGGSGPEWLSAVKPCVAVISCGRRNEYGHPAREVIDRLNSLGARIYRTDRNGAVMLFSDGYTIRARAYVRSPREGEAPAEP